MLNWSDDFTVTLYKLKTQIFMPPRSKISGHIVFVLSVILSSFWNFNLANLFWTVGIIIFDPVT